jgi:SH3-like domain-containing protein
MPRKRRDDDSIYRQLIKVGLKDPFIQGIVGLVVIAVAASFAISALGSGTKAIITLALSLSFGVILVILRAVITNIDNTFIKGICFASAGVIVSVFLVFAVFLIPAAFICWPPPYAVMLGLTSCTAPPKKVCMDSNTPIPIAACGQPNGQYVVTNVFWDDPVTGLNVRQTASVAGIVNGILPPNATQLRANCGPNWCEVECQNKHLTGWSNQRYLKLRSETLQHVTGSDHSAVSVRNGPDQKCSITGWVPWDGRDLIKHSCQPDAAGNNFCLVTYGDQTGWVDGNRLTPVAP